MKPQTIQNRFGELQTKWQSNAHPDNPNFMQVVEYLHIQSQDGNNRLFWKLNQSTKNYLIPNISLDESLSLYPPKN